jgi:hypothetical protein
MSKRKPARTRKARSSSKVRAKAAGSRIAGHDQTRANSKQSRVLGLLSRPSGATIASVMRSTGWQPHTVRGFFAAVVRKKLGLRLESEKTDGERVYRIIAGEPPTAQMCRVRNHAAAPDRSGRDRGRDRSPAVTCA